MSDAAVSAKGQCRCGALTFRTTAPPLLTGACHCRGCQRMTGGPYSLTSTYAREAFEVTSGEAVIGGVHGPEARHYHCRDCLSWVYTEPVGLDGFTNVRTSMLDQPPADPPFVESQTAEGFAWATTGATHSFARFPEMGDYERLMAVFATERAN